MNILAAREGVATARALRKWLTQHPGERFEVTVVLLNRAMADRAKGQDAMAKGVATVWNEIAPEVLKRGARVINAATPKPLHRAGADTQTPPPKSSPALRPNAAQPTSG